MDNGGKKVVMAQMRPRERREWTKEKPRKRRLKWDKRLLRRSVPLAAAFSALESLRLQQLCLATMYSLS
ncbi:MAG: hypothetical protein ACLR07_02095 [Christensenellales bacterium]